MSQATSFPLQAPILPLQSTSILEVALTEYRRNTGNDLLSHPLSDELQRCDSLDDILVILQRQANTLEQLKDGNRRLMKWVSSSVNILYSISSALGDGARLVRLRLNLWLLTCILTLFSGVPTCETNFHWDWYSPCRLYLCLSFSFLARFNIDIVQAAKDVTASHDMLLDLFGRMEDFFRRLKIYSQSCVDTELAEVLVKVVVKVLNILSLATKEVEQSRASGSFLHL
jgi:hypothetical protein